MSPSHSSPPAAAEVRAGSVRLQLVTLVHRFRPVLMGMCLFVAPIPLLLWVLLHSAPPDAPQRIVHPYATCMAQLEVFRHDLLSRPEPTAHPSCGAIEGLPHPGPAHQLRYRQAKANLAHLASRNAATTAAALTRHHDTVQLAYDAWGRQVAEREWLMALTGCVLLPPLLMLWVLIKARSIELLIDNSRVRLNGVSVPLHAVYGAWVSRDHRLEIVHLDGVLSTPPLDEYRVELKWVVGELQRAAAGHAHAREHRVAEPHIRSAARAMATRGRR